MTVATGPDVRVENHGTIFLFRPETEEGERFLRERTDHARHQWFGGALAVEHRLARPLVDAITDNGLEVE